MATPSRSRRAKGERERENEEEREKVGMGRNIVDVNSGGERRQSRGNQERGKGREKKEVAGPLGMPSMGNLNILLKF